ncbi:MAG: hypothetical protein HY438_00590 [DPANN group archaeon]|nr:hypothetical protein [DPANN group archaeon]
MPIFLDEPAGKQKPTNPITMKTQEELEDLVGRVERAAKARACGTGTYIVRLDELENGMRRLHIIGGYSDTGKQEALLTGNLKSYCEAGGKFPVYVVNVNSLDKVVEKNGVVEVREIRAGQHCGSAIVTHAEQ